jgi:predicted transcriptional regulator
MKLVWKTNTTLGIW